MVDVDLGPLTGLRWRGEPFVPRPLQRELLAATGDFTRETERMAGKTLGLAVLALRELMYGRQILWVAPSQKMVECGLVKLDEMLHENPDLRQMLFTWQRQQVISKNGGRLVNATSRHGLIGREADLVLIDEEPYLRASTQEALRPILHVGARKVALGTSPERYAPA